MKRKNTPNTLVRESILDIMPQEGCFGVPQIRELLLREKGLVFGKDYTEGNISNALYVLSNSGLLMKPDRGVYQRPPLKNKSSEDCNSKQEGINPDAATPLAYDIQEVLNLFKKDKNKLKEISHELSSALKNINLCNGATDQEFEQLKEILDFKSAFTELLDHFAI